MEATGQRRESVHAAEESDAERLTVLALRAKAHWGYDAEFIEDCRAELTITAEYIRIYTVKVAEHDGNIVGFYSLQPRGDQVELDNLFVEPAMIGKGIGKLLWTDAVAAARAGEFATMMIASDPFAEGFYLTMGAVRIGTIESTVRPGRQLPLLHFKLS